LPANWVYVLVFNASKCTSAKTSTNDKSVGVTVELGTSVWTGSPFEKLTDVLQGRTNDDAIIRKKAREKPIKVDWGIHGDSAE